MAEYVVQSVQQHIPQQPGTMEILYLMCIDAIRCCLASLYQPPRTVRSITNYQPLLFMFECVFFFTALYAFV